MAEKHVHVKGGQPGGSSGSTRVKRILFWVFLTLGVAAFITAIGATFLVPEAAEPWLVGALVALVVSLAGEVVLLVIGGGRVFDEEEEWYDWQDEAAAPAAAPKPAPTQMVLKCAKCARTFPLVDDGSRPLKATCPHCGRSGMLKEPPASAAGR